MSERQIRFRSVAAVAALLGALPAAGQNQHDMTFHTVPPCTVVDTRVAGGALVAGQSRTFNVVGSASFASQGGSATGCGVPGFSNGVAQVQAVELAVTSTNTAGPGHIVINAADQPLLGAVLSITAGLNLTNTSAVAVAQTSGIGDIKVVAGVSGTDVILRVVGYYSKPMQTVWVHPVPGNATASGTALINALAGITNASAAKPYVLKIEPGIYDLGTTMLNMKPYVDIEGSGQQATIIQGAGGEDFNIAVVNGAPSSELRDLQVKSTGRPTDGVAIPILISSADTHIRRVTATSSGPSTCSLWGIRTFNASSEITDATVILSGGAGAQGITSRGIGSVGPKIHSVHITVSNSGSTAYGFLVTSGGVMPEIENAHVEVSGGSIGYGFFQDGLAFTDSKITGSTFLVNGTGIYFRGSSQQVSRTTVRANGGTSYGVDGTSVTIDNSEIAGATATVTGQINIGGSKLDGGPASGLVTCAGVWDESYTFFAGPVCP